MTMDRKSTTGADDDVLWLNGRVIAKKQAQLDPGDRGFLLGDGLFETLLAKNGRIEHLELHLRRLRNSAVMLGIPIKYDDEAITDGLDGLLVATTLSKGLSALRITVTRGAGQRGLLPPEVTEPCLMMTAVAYHPPREESFAARIVAIRRNEGSPLSRIKSLNYLDNVLALQEAVAAGADEALMRNNAGQICGGSRNNLFVVRAGQLITPPIADGVLDGVKRRIVLDCARNIGCPIREASLSPMDLLTVDEAFLTNSLMNIKPLHRIDERILPIGPVTEVLMEALERK